MSTVAEVFRAAVEKHRAGQWQEAESQYRRILEQEPRHANALNLLGLIGWQSGRYAEAVEYLRKAVEIDPSQAAIHGNLAEAYRGLGMYAEGIASYQQAARLQGQVPLVHYNLGTLCQQAGRLDEAAAAYQRAIDLQSDHAAAWHALGTLHEQQGRVAESRQCYQRAIDAMPQEVLGYLSLGDSYKRQGDLKAAASAYTQGAAAQPSSADAQFKLGNIRQLEQDWPQAIACYRRAIELNADYAEAWCNLGNALRESGNLSEAISSLERAIELQPELAAAFSNLGVALQDSARFTEAEQYFQRAIEIDPQRAEFHFNLGTVLKDQGRVREALGHYERALQEQLGYAQAVCSRGMALLSLGDFSQGWADYERRVECPQFDTLSFPQPRWRGEPLAGRTLLVHCEQGLGDTLQFIRYLHPARQRAGEGKVIVAAQQILLPLLQQSGFANLVAKENPLPPFDVHIPLMSLPAVLGTTVDTVPRDVPYLHADAERVVAWRDRLQNDSGAAPDSKALRVGIAWQGRTNYRGDRLRSIPLAKFVTLAAVSGVRLFSLQKGPGSEQLAAQAGRLPITDLSSTLDLSTGAFLDTAAVMQNLDLVVTSDTAIAHLAGALGVRVWVPLTFAPDWRWLVDRDDSPWYPSMRLFRQRQLGDWDEVFARMAAELNTLPRR